MCVIYPVAKTVLVYSVTLSKSGIGFFCECDSAETKWGGVIAVLIEYARAVLLREEKSV